MQEGVEKISYSLGSLEVRTMSRPSDDLTHCTGNLRCHLRRNRRVAFILRAGDQQGRHRHFTQSVPEGRHGAGAHRSQRPGKASRIRRTPSFRKIVPVTGRHASLRTQQGYILPVLHEGCGALLLESQRPLFIEVSTLRTLGGRREARRSAYEHERTDRARVAKRQGERCAPTHRIAQQRRQEQTRLIGEFDEGVRAHLNSRHLSVEWREAVTGPMPGQIRAVQLAIELLGQRGEIQSATRKTMQGEQSRATTSKAVEGNARITQAESRCSGFRRVHDHDES